MADYGKLGTAIGEVFNPQEAGGRAGSLAEKIALQQYGASVQHDKWLKQQLVSKGYGVNVEQGSIVIDEKAGYSPKEAFLAVEGWKDTQMKSFDNLTKQQEYNGKKYNWMMDVINKSVSGTTGYKGDQRIEVEEAAIIRAMDAYEKVYGKPIEQDLGVNPINDYRSGLALKEVFDKTNKLSVSKAYAMVQQKKNASTSTDHLNYSQAYYMLKPSDREGWVDPKDLEKQFPPRDIVEAQVASENWKKEAQFGGDLSRNQRTQEMTNRVALNKQQTTPKGFDSKSKRLVSQMPNGDFVYNDTKEPYEGGQLKPINESQMISMMTENPGFGSLPEDEKRIYYEMHEKDKTALPQIYYRDPASKNAFTKGFAEYMKNKEGTGSDVITLRESTKALAGSLKKQQTNRGMMESFVKNINGQVSKVEGISRDIVKRVGVRSLDLPAREFTMRFIGSGHEQVLSAYMKEISAEIAKLAQGSAASIALLPEGARQEWERIHDPSLSLKELIIILNGTRDMANIRLKSVEDAIDKTIEELRGGNKSTVQKTGKPKTAADYLKKFENK